ncbi:hypothetical protein LHL11_20000, partial [Escherichia coli]|nr:hypothetical protein [Escherichia coli]
TGGTADRNRSHWSTSKTPSYTKSVSWQHHQHMAPKLAGNIRSFTRNQMVKIERQAIIEAWQEWEAYQ